MNLLELFSGIGGFSLLGNAVSPPIVEKVAARILQTTNLDNL